VKQDQLKPISRDLKSVLVGITFVDNLGDKKITLTVKLLKLLKLLKFLQLMELLMFVKKIVTIKIA
jgi:hypothetical protein